MDKEKIQEVLRLHQAWLRRDTDGVRANLWSADLQGADLRGADLPPPTMMLLASWRECSVDLARDLMRYDAANHPHPDMFDVWAAGGSCPYLHSYVERAANFQQRQELWSPGPAPSAYQLMVRLLQEHCKWTETSVNKTQEKDA